MKVAEDITKIIGKTPMVFLNRIVPQQKANLVAGKLEFMNPLGSVKDRIGIAMIEAAEKSGQVNRSTVIIEPTSGNTGIALAFVCAVKGYRLILTMPESMSEERRRVFQALGAELILTPQEEGMQGAISRAEFLVKKFSPNSFMPNQFRNFNNPNAHYQTTAKEIWEDTEGKIDVLVAGVGTGGTITGVGKFLKERKKDILVVAVEPEKSAVLSGKQPSFHTIQGIGAGFIPEVLDRNIIDKVITVKEEDAFAMTKKLARLEGIFAGISSGAAVWAAVHLINELENKLIVVVLPDNGYRYISTGIYDN